MTDPAKSRNVLDAINITSNFFAYRITNELRRRRINRIRTLKKLAMKVIFHLNIEYFHIFFL